MRLLGYIFPDVYNGGDFVSQSNGGDESQWTSRDWFTPSFGGPDDHVDSAFKASFSAALPTSKAQCKTGG